MVLNDQGSKIARLFVSNISLFYRLKKEICPCLTYLYFSTFFLSDYLNWKRNYSYSLLFRAVFYAVGKEKAT